MINLTKQTETLSFGGINSLFPPGGIPSPTRLVSPHTRTRRALNECGSMLFKACFHTCSSGVPHFINWPQCSYWRHLWRIGGTPPPQPAPLASRGAVPETGYHNRYIFLYLPPTPKNILSIIFLDLFLDFFNCYLRILY